MKAVIGHTTTTQIAFVGPFGVGKTTAVNAVSDTPVVNTEVRRAGITDEDTRVGRKLTTTVGLDYGEYQPGAGVSVAVIGTPGQNRFGVMRKAAIPKGTAIVLWLYGQNDYALDEAKEWLEYLQPDLRHATLTVAVTRLEAGTGPSLESYRPLLDALAPGAALLAADPRNRSDVIEVLRAAMGQAE